MDLKSDSTTLQTLDVQTFSESSTRISQFSIRPALVVKVLYFFVNMFIVKYSMSVDFGSVWYSSVCCLLINSFILNCVFFQSLSGSG